MNKIIFEVLLQISGISAASGLHYNNNNLFLISDDSNVLYEYKLNDNQLKKHTLFDNIQEQTSKKDKLDFEALAYNLGNYYVLGSGSKQNREIGAIYNPITKNNKILNLDLLYPAIASFANLNENELNIEGALFYNNELYLFNRGNGKNNRNFIAIIQGKNIEEEFNIVLKDIDLPKLNGLETGFSDAVLVDDKIYFLATAEATKSTYLDGKVGGTIIGILDAKKLKLKKTKVVSNDKKLEGITVYENAKKEISFLICEDADTSDTNTTIYKLSLKK